MNYFDDLKVTFVGKIITNQESQHVGAHRFYGMGIMNGKDYVRRYSPENDTVLKVPFVYLIHPTETSAAWMTVNGSPRDNRWFIFEGPRAERMVSALLEVADKRNFTIPVKKYNTELAVIHQTMLQLFLSGVPARSYRLAVCAENFVGAVYDAINTAEMQSPVHELIVQTIRAITETPGDDFDFKSLAGEYKISYYHFRRCFVQYCGVPLHEFLLQKRFALALSLLKSGTESIKEISERCGFQNASDFARFIRKRSGSNPSDFRKRPQFSEI